MKYTDKQLVAMKRDIHMPSILQSRLKLTQNGMEYDLLCPFHADKVMGSCKVYFKDDWWQMHCYPCAKTWNLFQVIQQTDKLSFGDAVDKVVSAAAWEEGKVMAESTFKRVGKEKTYLTFPLSRMAPAEKALSESDDAVGWLVKRGINRETAEQMHLGFIESAEEFSPNHPWVNKGWIVIPTIQGGIITCVKYRSLFAKKQEVDGKMISGTLRLTGMQTSLYNLEAVSCMEDVHVVEGEPDCWALTQAGYIAVGYPSGEYTPTPAERDILKRANRVFLAGDNDAVGQKMKKLGLEITERCYVIDWPDGIKDANAALISSGGTETFQKLVEKLKSKALEKPVIGGDFYDLAQTMKNADSTRPMDNPRRLHFRDPAVDSMAITLPGDVVSIYATYTGTGKTTWCLDQFELLEAMKHGSIVLNYSAELSLAEFGRLVAANLTTQSRLELTEAHFKQASVMLEKAEAKFYVGYNPDLNRIGPVLDSIEWAIRRLGANIVVLDHLHFFARGERDDIKSQADAMQRIKNMARKWNVIFVVVGQSRKEQPNSKGRQREASDAFGSSTFTTDASTILHLHRGVNRGIDWSLPDSIPLDRLDVVMEITCVKGRSKGAGPSVTRQTFVGKFGKFHPFTAQMALGGGINENVEHAT